VKSGNISETEQDTDTITRKLYRMVPTSMTLSDLDGHLSCLKSRFKFHTCKSIASIR